MDTWIFSIAFRILLSNFGAKIVTFHFIRYDDLNFDPIFLARKLFLFHRYCQIATVRPFRSGIDLIARDFLGNTPYYRNWDESAPKSGSRIYLILLLKTSTETSYFGTFGTFQTAPKFGSRIYLILLLKTSTETSYYRCKIYMILLVAKRHIAI